MACFLSGAACSSSAPPPTSSALGHQVLQPRSDARRSFEPVRSERQPRGSEEGSLLRLGTALGLVLTTLPAVRTWLPERRRRRAALLCFYGGPGRPASLMQLRALTGQLRCEETALEEALVKDSEEVEELKEEKPTASEEKLAEEPERLWAGFSGIYCINLDRRPERWRFMQKQLRHFRVSAERFSAVDGQKLEFGELVEGGLISVQAVPRFFLPDDEKVFGIDLTPGAIGCALSHMKIWREIIEEHRDLLATEGAGRGGDAPRYLVIEDDCRFSPTFSEATLARRLAEVPGDWEICWLGGVDSLGHQALLQVAPGVRRVYAGFRTTTAYAITAAGARAALEVCTPLMWQVDTHLTQREVIPQEGHAGVPHTAKPRGYSLYPPLVEQAKELFGTDVQKDDSEHRFLRQATLPEDLSIDEPLLLLGTCNSWKIEEAMKRHAFQPVRKAGRPSKVCQESSVRVELPQGGLAFQVISAKRFWNWRLYPMGGEDPACRVLHRGSNGKMVACLAVGQDNNLAHGKDFVIRDDSSSVVEVHVTVSSSEGIRVWYT